MHTVKIKIPIHVEYEWDGGAPYIVTSWYGEYAFDAEFEECLMRDFNVMDKLREEFFDAAP